MNTFEQRIARLEKIAEAMRDPELPLEKSFELFEEGMTLAKSLQQELEHIQAKVEILLNSLDDKEGPPQTADFTETNQEEQF